MSNYSKYILLKKKIKIINNLINKLYLSEAQIWKCSKISIGEQYFPYIKSKAIKMLSCKNSATLQDPPLFIVKQQNLTVVSQQAFTDVI